MLAIDATAMIDGGAIVAADIMPSKVVILPE